MSSLKLILEFLLKPHSPQKTFFKNCLLLIILARLLTLEESQLAIIAEIISSLIIVLDMIVEQIKKPEDYEE